MKNILYLFCLTLFTKFSFSQVYSENWNNPSGWTLLDEDGDGNSWLQINQAALVGSPFETYGNTMYSQAINETNGVTLSPDNYIVSPLINLGNLSGTSFLFFDAGYISFANGQTENIEVYGGTVAPTSTTISTYSLLHSASLTTPSTSNQIQVNVSQFNGQAFYLAYRHVNSSSQTLIFLDNIQIINSNFSISNTTACLGSELTFNNTSVGNGASVNVTWDFGPNANPITSTNSTQNVTFSSIGTQTITQVINGIPMETKTIEVVDVPTPSFTADVTVGCSPLRVTFTSLEGPNGITFNFSDGSSLEGQTVTKVFTTPGFHSVYLTQTISDQCQGSDSLSGINMINVLPKPNASFIPTETNLDMKYPIVSFMNTSTGAISYEWDFGDTSTINSTELSPMYMYPEDTSGTYEVTLTVRSIDGCIDSTKMRITVEEKLIFYVPNTFTPNGDEFNNTFKPIITSGVDPKNYNLSIFNRWGNLVFESNDYDYGWDGDFGAGNGIINTDTFIYKIQFGTKKNDEVKLLVGTVVLLK